MVKPRTAVVTGTENSGKNAEGTMTREGNVRFECSWENSGESIVTEVIPIEQGIQKFESWLPPSMSSSSSTTRPSSVSEKNEGGDGGDCSGRPLSCSRKIQPYSRRCKSTCSITLANSNNNSGTATVSFENQSYGGGESGRASSLPPEKPPVKDAETQTICSREKSGSSIKRVPSTKIKVPGSSQVPSRVPSVRDSKDEATYSIVNRIRKNIFEAEAPPPPATQPSTPPPSPP